MDQSGLLVSSAILFTKKQRKETSKRRKNLTNSVKYKSDDEQCMNRTMNNLKVNKNIENDYSMSRYTYVVWKAIQKPLINFDRFVIPGKYQTSPFVYCQDLTLRARPQDLGLIFSLSVSKKLIAQHVYKLLLK